MIVSCNNEQQTTEVKTDSSSAPKQTEPPKEEEEEFIPVESDGAIVPGRRVDAVKVNSSEKSMIRDYGKNKVVSRQLDEGEGNIVSATVLFPGEKNELEVFWKDAVNKQNPRLIKIKGKGAMWNIDHKISIGTDLETLLALNKKPFFITGCCFDAPFTVINWNNGSVAKLTVPGVVIRLTPTVNTAELNKKIVGDESYPVTDNLIRNAKMEVSTIIVRFD